MNKRVANCQLEDVLNGEDYGVECDEWNDTSIHDMANDLLEARELIEKQGNLIKGMRRYIDRVGIYQLDQIDATDRLFYMDKSKEYV